MSNNSSSALMGRFLPRIWSGSGARQHLEQDRVDGVRGFIRGPVTGFGDQADVGVGTTGAQDRHALWTLGVGRSIEFAPHAVQRRLQLVDGAHDYAAAGDRRSAQT